MHRTDADRKEFCGDLAEQLEFWLLDVRHYPAEGHAVEQIIKMMRGYEQDLNYYQPLGDQ